MSSNQKLTRILLVDDHRDTVDLTALILAKRGYEVVRTYSVTEARVAAAKDKCDIVISDGIMPDGNGVDLMRELKAAYQMAGILVSGSMENGAAVEKDGFRFLAKPIRLQNLLDVLESLPGR